MTSGKQHTKGKLKELKSISAKVHLLHFHKKGSSEKSLCCYMVNVDFSFCNMYRVGLPRNAVYAPSFLKESPTCSILCCLRIYVALLLKTEKELGEI